MILNRPDCRFDRGLLPPAQAFYLRELGELRRQSPQGWTSPKSGCPFHASESKTSFRVNLRDGRFTCFGCGAKGGDIVTFLRKRYGYSFREACISVGAWSEPGFDTREIHRLQLERERQQAELAEREETGRGERLHARVRLLELEKVFRMVNFRLSPDMDAAEQELYFEFLSDLFDEIREADAKYCRLAGLEYR